jgi:poly [ADP-ribose] polymerase
MAIKEQAMLIFTDALNNNNKFYEIILNDDDSINLRWGRVDAKGQNKTTYGGKREFDSTIKAKLAKGYARSKTVSVNPSSTETNKVTLAETAKRDILGDKVNDKNSSILVKLVERLSEMNRHQIMAASGGSIKVDESGLIVTSLGLVTKATVEEARLLLNNIEKHVSKKAFTSEKYIDGLNNYLKLIPQKVPTRRGWYETFFTDFTNLSAQNAFLDQLEGSLDLYKTKEDEIRQKMNEIKKPQEEVFKTRLELVSDIAVLKRIQKFYEETINTRHVSSHLKLKNVYEISNEEWLKRFDPVSQKLGNSQLLWHGTRAFNVLSIFKNGLIIPRSGGSYHITGRMFGDGLYFSDQSSKSLNYSYGYWDGASRDNNCFMFLADVAMGKSHTPSAPTGSLPKGFDSMFAKANKSGVMNNEMIVYDVGQANLRYLCEFSDK